MKLVKHSAHALLFIMALIASLIVPSGTASAASTYDNVVTLTSQVKLEQNSSHGSGRADISNNWHSIVSDCANWTSGYGSYGVNCATANAALSAALTQGHGWAVVQQTAKIDFTIGSVSIYAGDKFATIMWNPESDANAVFRAGSFGNKELRLTGSSYSYGFNIALNNDPNNPTPVVSNGERTASMAGTAYTIVNSTDEFPYYSSAVFFANIAITYPSGYEGVSVPTVAPLARYVAMGDSFSSGEGVSPFEAGTDTGSNSCHRSLKAYPRLLGDDSNLGLGSMAFVACSGATTQNVLYGGSAGGAWGEAPQIDALSLDTEVVTITVGGNDVGFRDFAIACSVGSCDFATTAYSDIHGKISNNLPAALAEVYEAIDSATSSTAKIYVVGYPQIAPADMPTGPNSACYPLNGGTDNPDPELNDGATAYAVVSQLNSAIADAVTAVNSAKFHFVDPNLSGSPFIGHDWCQQDKYFNIITYNNIDYSFHPNKNGQGAYATVVEGSIE